RARAFAVLEGPPSREELPGIEVERNWQRAFIEPALPQLEAALAQYLLVRPWFVLRKQEVPTVRLLDWISLVGGPDETAVVLLLLRVEYLDGEGDFYALPVGYGTNGGGRVHAEG